VAFDREVEFTDDFELSLCCNTTVMTQSPEEQKDGSRETSKGRESCWVTESLVELSFWEAFPKEEGDWTRVSEIEICRGSTMSVGREIEC
jgi:hypothetical protein